MLVAGRNQPGETMRKTTWNTYKVRAYSHDVAQHAPSTGGAHCHQVRRTAAGWQWRIMQVNGKHVSYGASQPIAADDGEACYLIAKALG